MSLTPQRLSFHHLCCYSGFTGYPPIMMHMFIRKKFKNMRPKSILAHYLQASVQRSKFS